MAPSFTCWIFKIFEIQLIGDDVKTRFLIAMALFVNSALAFASMSDRTSRNFADPFPVACQGLPEGGSVTGYLLPVGPCITATVVCAEGFLTGPMPFPSCTEMPFPVAIESSN